MALDSHGTKSNIRSSRHARNPTPVIPALPLGFGDGKSRRPSRQSRPSSLQDNVSEGSTSKPFSEGSESLRQSDRTLNGKNTPSNKTRHGQSSAQHDFSTEKEPDSDKERDQQAPELLTLSTSKETTRNELKSQENDKINEDVAASIASTREQQAFLPPVHQAQQEKAGVLEEDGPVSELEISSAAPSNTTGITDYGSSVAESILETVMDGNNRSRRISIGRHRKSEVAPEVSLNGDSPRRVPDEYRQHNRAANGSSASQRTISESSPIVPVHEYLLFLANSRQFSDVVLQLNQADRAYQPSLHATHSLLLMRSDRLSKFSAEYDQSVQSKVINLFPARNILPHAFEAALRFFYADYLLSLPTILPSASYRDPMARSQALEYVMSYWISGVELGIGPVKARSYEILKELLELDVAEIVAKEVRDLRTAISTLPTKDAQDEVQDIANILSRLLAQLLRVRVNFEDFTLSPDSPPTTSTLPHRFADLDFNRSSNPALSGVVFGSLPNQPSAPSPQSIASTILLNVDFDTLVIIATELITVLGRSGEHVIRQVVYRREEDREQVVSNRTITNKQRLDNSAWHSAGVKESMDEHGRLKQERVGFILPSRSR